MRTNQPGIDTALAIDVNEISKIRAQNRTNHQQAMMTVAQEFEALFLQMMTKSMRDASFKSDLFSSQTQEFYTTMFDQQLSKTLAKKGVGLANVLITQLSKIDQQTVEDTQALKTPEITVVGEHQKKIPYDNFFLVGEKENSYAQTQRIYMDEFDGGNLSVSKLFIAKMTENAEKFSLKTGLPSEFGIAHAAHESGWGQRIPVHADGRSSYNLFGIKANKEWTGGVVEANTTEFRNGVLQKSVEKFKSYPSYEEAFSDYANLLLSSPRYRKVLESRSSWEFARSLQLSGYATDPEYAKKIHVLMKENGLT